VERHSHCLCLQVTFLQQARFDDYVAVLALGRRPLANLDEAAALDAEGSVGRGVASGGRLSMMGREFERGDEATATTNQTQVIFMLT